MTARALQPTDVVMALARTPGWSLHGDGDRIAIERAFRFASHGQAMIFVNSIGWLAEQIDHHPELVLEHRHCVVRWRTHDAGGLTALDFDAARRTDALVPA